MHLALSSCSPATRSTRHQVHLPSQDALLGRKALKEIHGNWVGVAAPCGHETLGRALRPLVEDEQIPASWLVGPDGNVLGVNSLAAIETAIELARRLDEDWTFWIDAGTAIEVITTELPRLHAKLAAQLTPPAVVETPATTIVTIGSEAIGTSAPMTKTAEKKAKRATREAKKQEWSDSVGPKVRELQIAVGHLMQQGGTMSYDILADVPKDIAPKAKLRIEETYRDPSGTVHFSPGLVVRAPLMRGGAVVRDASGKTQLAIQVCCTAKRGRCLRLTPVGDARVGKSLGSLGAALGVKRLEEITESRLLNGSFCAQCADEILRGGHQSVSEALGRIEAEVERSKAETLAALRQQFGKQGRR